MSSTDTAHVRLDWSPHDGQRQVLESSARFRMVACGRRWGKTEMCAHEVTRYLGQPNTLVWWVAPTYDIADIGFDAVEGALPQPLIDGEPKFSKPKAIDLKNGSRISFRSADREDSLRGEGLDLLVIDEAAMVPERAWSAELRPTLSDTLGDMIAISTPKGRGWFYRWWERGQSSDHAGADSWRAPTYDNPHVPDSEIEAAKHELPERVFEQEYLAKFLDESGGVFDGLDKRLFTGDYELPVPPEEAEPPFATGVDFARHQDWRVTITLDSAGRLVYYDRDQHEAWPQIQQEVEDVAGTYEGVVSVDASRDNKIVADLERSGLAINPVKFSTSRKQDLIEDLVARVESGELTAPDSMAIEQIRHELSLFEYEVTPAGNVRYQAPEGFHDDTVDALALASDALANVQMRIPTGTASLDSSDDDQITANSRQFKESELGGAIHNMLEDRDSPW